MKTIYELTLPGRAALSVAVAFAPATALAGQDAFHREVQQQITVSADGTARVFAGQLVVDRKLSINRRNGEKVGDAVGLFRDAPVRVLAEGSSSNAFVATWLGPSAGGGVHFEMPRVEEHAAGPRKPFFATAGGIMFVGLCE